jgi:hypothetical protein
MGIAKQKASQQSVQRIGGVPRFAGWFKRMIYAVS